MSDAYVPIDDLAKHLSVKVSTVRSWVQKGLIAKAGYIKIGSTYRFNIPTVVANLRGDSLPADTANASIEDIVSSYEDELFAEEDSNEPEQLELDFSEDEDI